MYPADAQPLTGGPVKIGHSGDVAARIRQLESHYGQPLALLGTIEGGYDEEQAIHARFAHLRLDGPGRRGVQPEQFRPAPDLMAFIGRPLLVGANPTAVEAMPGPKADPNRVITPIRSTTEWKEWLGRLAEFDGESHRSNTNISDTMDRAAIAYARAIGFKEMPPKR